MFLIDEPSSAAYYEYMLILCYVNKIYYYYITVYASLLPLSPLYIMLS